MPQEVSRSDVDDSEFLDAEELASDGYSSYRTVNVSSIVSANKNIVILSQNTLDILKYVDYPLQPGDKVRITGNAAAGTYTVDEIINDTTFSVIETIINASDGYAEFIYPSGASNIGYDPSEQNTPYIISTNVQDALTELSNNIGGIANHENLDTLVHDLAEDGYSVATYNNLNTCTFNYITNYTTYTNTSMTTKVREQQIAYTGHNITQVITIQYNQLGNEASRLTENIVYEGNRIKTVTSTKIP
jgi:hypothetical protein